MFNEPFPFVTPRRHPNSLTLHVTLRGGPSRRRRRAFFSRLYAEARRLGLVFGQKLGLCVFFGAERICTTAHRQQMVYWLIDQPEAGGGRGGSTRSSRRSFRSGPRRAERRKRPGRRASIDSPSRLRCGHPVDLLPHRSDRVSLPMASSCQTRATTATQSGAVYLLPHIGRQRFKVGWSLRPLRRARHLPEGLAGELDLARAQVAWLREVGRARQVERTLLRGLAPYGVDTGHLGDGRTEWFDARGLGLARQMLVLLSAVESNAKGARLLGIEEPPT